MTPLVELEGATLSFGERTLWSELDLSIRAGEFVAVLGPNGAGKSTLLRVLLGLQKLTDGRVRVLDREPQRGNPRVGYIPQKRAFDPDVPLRARDLVRLGLDGHRWGPGRPDRRTRNRVDAALAAVGAGDYADSPVGLLSGGEQQRLQIAQSLLGDPALLLCDEPLLSLDLRHQQEISQLIDRRRRTAGTGVVFVTHEINPVLEMVDRILFLVGGRWTVGAPDQVLTTATMSELYRSPVDVLRVRGRVVVVGGPEGDVDDPEHSDFSDPLPAYQR